MKEDEMVGCHHRLDNMNLNKLWELVMDSAAWCVADDGQGSLVCCSPWGPKELDMTEQLN